MADDDPTSVCHSDGQTALALLRDIWMRSGLPAEATQPVEEVAAGAQWEAMAQCIWGNQTLFYECDQVPGLRSWVRRVATGGAMQAITSLVERAIMQRQDALARAIAVHEGFLWIPDDLFAPFQYIMEMNDWGWAPGFDDDDAVADVTASPIGVSGVFRRWVTWVSDGGERQGWVVAGGVVGSLLARGIPLRSARADGLVRACRCHPSPWPTQALAEPSLLYWLFQPRLPDWSELVRDGGAGVAIGTGVRDYHATLMAGDGRTSLMALLVRTGESSTGRALVAVVRQALEVLLPLGSQASNGWWHVALGGPPRLGDVLVGRVGGDLVVTADGMAVVVTWLGLYPRRYCPDRTQPCSWPWLVLEQGGWSSLAKANRWQRGDGNGIPCIRFTDGRAHPTMPEVAWTPSGQREDTLARERRTLPPNSLDLAWEPPLAG